MTADANTPFRPVVIAPTYNNARTVIDVVAGVSAIGLPMIVVNDGCTDITANLLAACNETRTDLTILTHNANRGKADALRTGFSHAASRGYTHAGTIDTDGQLDAADLALLFDRARAVPSALMIGSRIPDSNAPERCAIGRRFSSLFVRIETGLSITDSQCGLRVYPIALLESVRTRSRRFAFETEIITRAVWAGFPIEQVPVTGRYFSEENRISHYRPWIDTLQITGLHLRLIGRALVPWPHWKRTRKEQSWLRALVRWLDPRIPWRDVRGTPDERGAVALGLAVGVFIGNTPLYGLHSILSLYVARRLTIRPAPILAGSFISTPPLGPILIVAAIAVGHFLLHGGTLPDWSTMDLRPASVLNFTANMLVEWIVGSVVVGFACMTITFFSALFLLGKLTRR
ncbi:MAG: DUF2062 domain-containing protein [Phycisphaerales bacterium]